MYTNNTNNPHYELSHCGQSLHNREWSSNHKPIIFTIASLSVLFLSTLVTLTITRTNIVYAARK